MLNFLPLLSFKRTATLSLVIFLLVSGNAFAETVHLISGKVIEGEIVLRNEELIKIDTGIGIPVTYYRDEIETIGEEPLAPIEKKQVEIIEATEIIEPVKMVEKAYEEELPMEVIPDEEAATLEGVDVFKEQPSPVAVKPKQQLPDDTTLDASKSQLDYLLQKIDAESGAPKAQTQKTNSKPKSKNAIIKAFDEYIKSQMHGFKETKAYFNQKLPFIKEKLHAVPVKIRQDAFFFSALFMAIMYILVCFPLMQIAKKLGKRHVWLIWLPIIQIFYFLHMSNKPLWWFLFFLVPILNLFMPLFLFIDILRSLGKSFWLIIPIIIPGVNVFTFWYLAISGNSETPLISKKNALRF